MMSLTKRHTNNNQGISNKWLPSVSHERKSRPANSSKKQQQQTTNVIQVGKGDIQLS